MVTLTKTISHILRSTIIQRNITKKYQDVFEHNHITLIKRQRHYKSIRIDVDSAKDFEDASTSIGQNASDKGDNIVGKIALITGGASGIGLEYGRYLLYYGARALMIADVDEKKGKQAIVKLTNKYGRGKVAFVKTDVSDGEELENAFKSCVSTWNGLDIVINNAAILDESCWEKEIHTNCTGLARGTLLGFKYMRKDTGEGDGGTIVNIASALIFQKPGGCPIHVGTKFFALGLGCSFGHASYYQRTGVRVLTMCPGCTQTKMLNRLEAKSLDQDLGRLLQREIRDMPIQKPECVGEALITVLQKGQPGSVWVCENGDTVYEIEIDTMQHTKGFMQKG